MSYDPTSEAATLAELPKARGKKAAANGKQGAAAADARVLAVSVEVPIDGPTRGYAVSHPDTRLTMRQAAALHILWLSVQAQHGRYSGGNSSHPEGAPVESASHGLRWLLDRLADSIELATGQDVTTDFGIQFSR